MSEYDAKSRASSKEFRANYDSIFRKKSKSQVKRCHATIPGGGFDNVMFCMLLKGHDGRCMP